MLDVDSAIDFLLDQGLLRHEELFAADVVVEAVPRRNRNLRVAIGPDSGVFIKQPDAFARASHASVRAEGDFYIHYASRDCSVGTSLPRLLLYQPALPVLVLELLRDHRSLIDHCRSFAPLGFPIHTWRALGRRLGEIHLALRQHLPGRDGGGAGALPSVCRAHRPTPDALVMLSPGGLSVLEIVQTSGAISDGLDRLKQLWDPHQIIHGDIRSGNILVRAGSGTRPDDIRIVDWELRQVGDPVWDLAGFVEVLVLYLLSGMAPAEAGGVDAGARGRLPWTVFQATVRAFWEGYIASEACTSASADTTMKLAEFSAARLVQSALEMTAQAADLPQLAVLVLQVSENVFANPTRAAETFLAIG